jgi:hypothetical protein
VLPDGRVGALFAVEDPAGETGDLFIAFERSGDRWLLDEIVQIGPAGALATPPVAALSPTTGI